MATFDLTVRKKKEIRKQRLHRVLGVFSAICMVLNLILLSIAVASIAFSYATNGEVPSIFTSELATKQFFALVLGLWVCSNLDELF